MRRSTPPTEIVLGLFVGMVAAFFVAQPLIWFLHHLGMTDRTAYSTVRTIPMGVYAVWSRVFWGGAFGILLAWIGLRYSVGLDYVVRTTLLTAAARTLVDWIFVPLFWRESWTGIHVGAILTPVFVNVLWAAATAVLLAAATLAAGTWGTKSPAELLDR